MRVSFSPTISRCTKGATAIEFAIVIPVLLLCIMGIIEYCTLMYASATLEAATTVAARELKTANNNNTAAGGTPSGICGSPAGSTQTQIQYINCIVKSISSGLLDGTQLQISAQTFGNPSTGAYGVLSVTTPTACTNDPAQVCTSPGVPANCQPTLCTENFGVPGDVVAFTVNYPWHILTPFMQSFLGTNGVVTLTSSVVAQNEPGSSLAIVQTVNGGTSGIGSR